jgi:hypothetical protein
MGMSGQSIINFWQENVFSLASKEPLEAGSRNLRIRTRKLVVSTFFT